MSEPTFGGRTLAEALDGLLAGRDTPGSGIRDEALRAEVQQYLDAMSENDLRVTVSRIARDLYLSEDALASGYGLEDAIAFGRFVYEDDLR